MSKEPEKWGKGHIEGIVAGSSANNAALSGAWIPAIVFAIPGTPSTAIGIGVLYLKGVNPGPTVFINNGELFYAVFIIFILANLVMFPLGSLAMRIAKIVLRIPRDLILPALLVLSATGAYAIDNDIFGIWILLGLGRHGLSDGGERLSDRPHGARHRAGRDRRAELHAGPDQHQWQRAWPVRPAHRRRPGGRHPPRLVGTAAALGWSRLHAARVRPAAALDD